MKLFLAVVFDLFDFLRQSVLPKRSESAISFQPETDLKEDGVTMRSVATLLNTRAPLRVEPDSFTVELNEKAPSSISADVFGLPEVGYICVPKARLMKQAAWAFDSVLTELSYGVRVEIFDRSGRFVRVSYQTVTGWVLKDEITTEETDVIPTFVPGKVYLAAESETKKLRLYIKDEFFAQELYVPVQPGEYVLFELLRKGLKIPWPETRPRTVGLWHTLLRGRQGVYTAIIPRTGSVIEYTTEEGVGCLGIVTTVTPEETITVWAVGITEEGRFETVVWPKSLWQEYRPVFMQFS